jgi:hypothetical protein
VATVYDNEKYPREITIEESILNKSLIPYKTRINL